MKSILPLALSVVALAGAAEPSQSAQGREWSNPIDGMRFVWIPGGSCSFESAGSVRTNTTLAGYWIGRTEVTVAQFRRFVRATGYRTDAERATNRWTWKNPGFKQSSKQPVVWVSASDALAYARWAGADLPSEVEWLHAARAGVTTRYPWGDELDLRYGWFRTNAPSGPRAVGGKLPNQHGLYDTAGNASEYSRIGECREDHRCFAVRGSSWSRCESYLTRQGFVAGNLVAQGLAPKLTQCSREAGLEPYPYDDDRGFRCVKRGADGPER